MSIKVSTMIWEKWPNGGSEMLCLLALADWCNDEGGSLYPSIKTLARKMRVSERQAQRVLHKFIKDGLVAVIGNENGGAPGTTRQYHLNVSRISMMPDYGAEETTTGDIGVTPDMSETGDTDDVDGCHGCRETGDMGVTQDVIYPLEEPPIKTSVPSEDVTDVFEHWRSVMGKSSRTVLDSNRKRLIQKALGSYSIDDVKSAITGCSLSPHHMGHNDRNTVYNGLDLILRNAEKIEQFIGYSESPPANIQSLNRSRQPAPDPYANLGDCEGRVYIPDRPSDSDEWRARRWAR